MNIVYTVNNNFVPQMAACICSICENNKDADKINFFILSQGISSINKKQLQILAEKYARIIHIIELQNIESYFDFEFDTRGWNSIVLARLLIGKLLPMEIERIIYLDGDTIVRDSLSELWQLDMKDCVIGMSAEVTVNKKRKEALGLENYSYYNAGVLLLDLKKWRENNIENKILQYYKNNAGNLFANDQDAINGALKGQIYTIPLKYNYCNTYYFYSYSFLSKLAGPQKFIDYEEYKIYIKNPAIIHYLGEERPWRKGNKHRYRNEYKNYLSKTYWKDTPDEDGWQLYFICWNLFNLFMRLFNGGG